MEKWKNINTAPKDGTRCWLAILGRVNSAFPPVQVTRGAWEWNLTKDDGLWITDKKLYGRITHWMSDHGDSENQIPRISP